MEETERKIVTGERAKELASRQELAFEPGVFDAVLARVSGSASGGDIHRSLKRRMVSIVIEAELCRPETFSSAFRLELMELDSDQELRALTKLGKFTVPDRGDLEDVENQDLPESEEAASAGQALAMALAREAIYAVNGRKLAPHEKALLWEILGFGGRLAAGMTFISHGTGLDPDLLGKSIASVEIA